MKIFLSWSGNRSKAVAELLNDWLRCVIQAAKPWISSRDIDRGALWFNEISGHLSETSVGIVCLTSDNKTKPWILFEAGALAKGLSHSRVCTFLVDLQPSDIEDPLAQFNHTFPTKDSIWALTRTLNGLLQQASLDERILLRVFETYWPQFEEDFQRILKEIPPDTKPEKRSEQSILAEILANTRGLSMKVRELDEQLALTSVRISRSPQTVVTMSDVMRREANKAFEETVNADARRGIDSATAARLHEKLRRLRKEQTAKLDDALSGEGDA
jgi:hypothetical protein